MVGKTHCVSRDTNARALLACYRRDARTIGERFGEWFEAPSYEEGVGDVGMTLMKKGLGMLESPL